MPEDYSHYWLESCPGAVSLTFDDGMQSQLERAIPILEENGLLGTFYVNPKNGEWKQQMVPWTQVAESGHEVGNHTVNHPCSCAFSISRENCLESMTLKDMAWEIAEGKRRIREAIPNQAEFTFCYPCYHAHVGDGSCRKSYVPVVADHHLAARGKGDLGNHAVTADLHHLYSFPVERHSASQMIGLIEDSIAQSRWPILTFHGIEEGHLAVSESDFISLCRYLCDHRARIWTAPVVSVAHAIQRWRQENRSSTT